MTPPTLVGPLLQFFFTDYLITQRRVSPQTIASYRDTFRLLLQFVDRETGIGPTALPVASLDAENILRFLDSLEKNRGNSVVSRNLRLTAIRSFYRMVAFRDPASAGIATHVLAIPLKRADTKVRPYLTREEIEAILASIDRTQWRGRRDYALLLSLYNTGDSCLGDRRSQVQPGLYRLEKLCPVARKRPEGPHGPALATHREDLEGVVPRTPDTTNNRRISQHPWRTADPLRHPSAASQDGRPDFVPQPQKQTDIAARPQA